MANPHPAASRGVRDHIIIKEAVRAMERSERKQRRASALYRVLFLSASMGSQGSVRPVFDPEFRPEETHDRRQAITGTIGRLLVSGGFVHCYPVIPYQKTPLPAPQF